MERFTLLLLFLAIFHLTMHIGYCTIDMVVYCASYSVHFVLCTLYCALRNRDPGPSKLGHPKTTALHPRTLGLIWAQSSEYKCHTRLFLLPGDLGDGDALHLR